MDILSSDFNGGDASFIPSLDSGTSLLIVALVPLLTSITIFLLYFVILTFHDSFSGDATLKRPVPAVLTTLGRLRALGFSNIALFTALLLSFAFSVEFLGGISTLLLALLAMLLSNTILVALIWSFYSWSKSNPVATLAATATTSADKNVSAQLLLELQAKASIGTYSYRIAHGFNNVLTIILANTEVLKLKLTDDPKKLKHLSKIELAVTSARDLLDQISHHAGSSDTAIERADEVSVDKSIKDAVKLTKTLLPAEVQLRFESTLGDVRSETCALTIRQLTLQMITLCYLTLEKYSGTILVKAQAVATSPAAGNAGETCQIDFYISDSEGAQQALPDALKIETQNSNQTAPQLCSEWQATRVLFGEYGIQVDTLASNDIECGFRLLVPVAKVI